MARKELYRSEIYIFGTECYNSVTTPLPLRHKFIVMHAISIETSWQQKDCTRLKTARHFSSLLVEVMSYGLYGGDHEYFSIIIVTR